MRRVTMVMVVTCVAVFAMAAWSNEASARPDRINQVPNNMLGCGMCHTSSSGGPRNAFGLDVEANLTEPGAAGQVQWELIFDIDSDGDGCTNGEELGDPEGAWRTGDPNPDGTVSDPADEGSSQECGDGTTGGTNNGTTGGENNGTAGGDTSGTTGGDTTADDGGGDGDDGGCSTIPGKPLGAEVLIALFGLFALRRRRPQI